MFVLTCPHCGEREDLSHYGNEFHCNACQREFDLEDMDFEWEEYHE